MRLLLTTLSFLLAALCATAQVTVTNISNGKFFSPQKKIVYKDKLVFFAGDSSGTELWYYDGTNMVRVSDLPNGSFGSIYEKDMVIAGDKLYMDGFSPATGLELGVWDGVNVPTVLTDVMAGPMGAEANNYLTYNDKVYFASWGDIWMYDPAINKTKQLTTGDLRPFSLVIYNDKIHFFSATKSTMYVYDLVADTVGVAPNFGMQVKDILYMSVCYGKLYYAAQTVTHGPQLYMYDGSNAPVRIGLNPTTTMHHKLSSRISATAYITGYKDAIYFIGGIYAMPSGISGGQLYKYDPAMPIGANNPSMVYKVNTIATELVEYDGKLYFTGSDTYHNFELWSYDGINDPKMVVDINPGAPDSNNIYKGASFPRLLTAYKGQLYFSATNTDIGQYDLYRLNIFPSGIQDANREDEITVYPNPATTQLYFAVDLKEASAFTITLTDITGREVYNSGMQQHNAGKANVQADVSALAGGNYIYRITTSEGLVLGSGKVVKE